jgi:hypothetical protein
MLGRYTRLSSQLSLLWLAKFLLFKKYIFSNMYIYVYWYHQKIEIYFEL